MLGLKKKMGNLGEGGKGFKFELSEMTAETGMRFKCNGRVILSV